MAPVKRPTHTAAPTRSGNRWVFADGTTLPVISGGDGPEGGAGGGNAGGQGGTVPGGGTSGVASGVTAGGGAGGSAPAQQTLAPPAAPAVDEKKIRDEATKATQEALAKELGVDLKEAAKIIKASRDAETAKLSEADRKLAEATDRDTKVTEREGKVGAAERDLMIRLALVNAGATSLDDAAVLVAAQLGDGNTIEALGEAVEAVKGRVAALFTAGTPAPTAPSGAPVGQPPGSPPATPGVEAGRAAAKAKREATHPTDLYGGLTPLGAVPANSNSN